jgi:hypothetical protein
VNRAYALLALVLSLSVVQAVAQSPRETPKKATDEITETRPVVEIKRSSEANLAKGEITFDDLKFDIEKGAPFKRDMLPTSVESLGGRKVKLRGYILPATLFKETDIEQFVLVRDNQECCFGPGAALYDCVIIEMVPGKTTDFVTRPVTVEGKFKVQEYMYPDGTGHFAIFRIDGEAVK